MKNLKMYINLVLVILKMSNHLIAAIIEFADAIITLLNTVKTKNTNKLLYAGITLITGKIIEKHVDMITVTIIDLTQLIIKYELLKYILQIDYLMAIILTILSANVVMYTTMMVTLILIITVVIYNVMNVLTTGIAVTTHKFDEGLSSWNIGAGNNLYRIPAHVLQGTSVLYTKVPC
jgi:hypothetical protein